MADKSDGGVSAETNKVSSIHNILLSFIPTTERRRRKRRRGKRGENFPGMESSKNNQDGVESK